MELKFKAKKGVPFGIASLNFYMNCQPSKGLEDLIPHLIFK